MDQELQDNENVDEERGETLLDKSSEKNVSEYKDKI